MIKTLTNLFKQDKEKICCTERGAGRDSRSSYL